MNDDMTSGTDPIPPRLTIRNQGQNDAAAVNPPVEASLKTPSSPASSQDALTFNKKKTARISLDQVTAEPGASTTVAGAGIASKTIRLAPALTGQVSVAPLPPVGKALTGMLVSDDTKRKTSRISLDSVLPQLEATAAGGDTTPKTIRIKRPTISAPAGVRPTPVEEAPVAVAPDSGSKSRTSRVDIPDEVIAQEGQQTQKKTIKIRRAEGGGADIKMAPRSVSISRSEADAPVATSEQVAQPHWSFVLVASAAVVTMCVMLYVLMAQAYPSLGWSVGG